MEVEADRVSFTPNKIINLYIAFKIKSWPFCGDNGFTLITFLFGAVKLTKNLDPDKYSYSEYRISFDVRGTFSLPLPIAGFGKNIVIFGVDISSFVHVDNKKDILILAKGSAQGLENSTYTADTEYSVNFTIQGKKLFKAILQRKQQ